MGARWNNSANVFDFRAELRRQKRERWLASLKYIGVGLLGGALLGGALIAWPTASASVADYRTHHRFGVCGSVRYTCVVDGDTIWLRGEKVRVADIDTPEISEPRCASEYDRGIKARDRLVVLLNDGEFELQAWPDRDVDQYERKLRVLVRDGHSIGDQLVSEGLARSWSGRREPWC